MKMILPRDFFPPFSSKDHRRRDYTFDNTFGLEAPRSQGKGGYMTFETCSSAILAFNHVNSPFVGRRDFHLRIRYGLSRKDFFVPLRFAQTRLDEEEGHAWIDTHPRIIDPDLRYFRLCIKATIRAIIIDKDSP